MIDLIILANLVDGPKHGYALKKQAGMVFAQSELHNNLVYPLLRRFTSQGWVTKKSAPGERGQTRQQYALTAAGRHALLERLNSFDEKEAQSSEEFLLRVGLFELLDPGTRQRILEARQEVLTRREEQFARLQQMELGAYGSEVVGFLRQRVKDELNWLRRLHRLAANNFAINAARGSGRAVRRQPAAAHHAKQRSTS
ncbi:MAG TPA: PadR family transcriptional regulator [Terriglobales bacterium]|nr:PadR family transcriptional regulator [Terriglobales bacterium]